MRILALPALVDYHAFEALSLLEVFTAHRKSRSSFVHATANLSACPSHFSIVSKRWKAEGCGLHYRVAPVSLVF